MKIGSLPDFNQTFHQAIEKFGRKELSSLLEISKRTLYRWEAGSSKPPDYALGQLLDLLGNKKKFKSSIGDFSFITIASGVGASRLAFEGVGGRCIFACEADSFARKIYNANFPGEAVYSILEARSSKTLPNLTPEVVAASFPGKSFSRARRSIAPAEGKPSGFNDPLIKDILEILVKVLRETRPKAVVLEFVSNFFTHNDGKSFSIIKNILRNDFGYDLHWSNLDGSKFVPQKRKQSIVIGFISPTRFKWHEDGNEIISNSLVTLNSILHKSGNLETYLSWDADRFFDFYRDAVQTKYTLSKNQWAFLIEHAKKHKSMKNGFGFGLVGPNDVSRTLSARYSFDGSEILIRQSGERPPRKLTPRECARLQGFDDSFRLPVSDHQAYSQIAKSSIVGLFGHLAALVRPYVI